MKNTSIVLGVVLAVIVLVCINHSRQECESNGGRYMKTLYNTYECIYERSR